MTAFALETRNEKAVSGALALVMHLLFFALLVFGVAWQKHEPAAMVAELWSSLPAPPPPKAEPEPPKPQPKAEAMRLAREQDEALRKLAQSQAAAQAKLVDEYKRRIQEKIKRFVIEPPNLPKTAQVEFDVVLLPGGEVLSVKLRKSSALATYDSAVERAILKAQPLPLPPDPAMFKYFRELNLIFRPEQ